MHPRRRHIPALLTRARMGARARAGAAALLACALAGVLAAGAGAEVAPLPASEYGIRAACGHVAGGHAGCMALQLVPLTAEAKAHTHPLGIVRRTLAPAPSAAAGSFGLRPSDVHSAYNLPASAPGAQTVAIVDAFNNPEVESDLREYSEEFGLPACTGANGCLSVVNELGSGSPLPYPKSRGELETGLGGSGAERVQAEEAAGWGLEISLDIDAVHATCQSCHIELIEARSSSVEDLEQAEQTAVESGAGEVTNSWGGPEPGETPATEAGSPFDHPGTVITASAGDDGYLSWDAEAGERGYADFPASSPHVVSVGGTRLSLGAGSSWRGETVWNGSGAGGGGCSTVFGAQPWQQATADWASVGCGSKRAVADISADADPYTGLAVHDTSPACRTRYLEGGVEHTAHWCTIGGTSLASPMISAVFALAGGSGGVPYPTRTLYENAAAGHGSMHDVTVGSNGECAKPYAEETGLSECKKRARAAPRA
jgi:subtilase family serine protease